MPFGDRTGPLGQGPRTGRGLGYCAGYDTPGYTKPGPGFGRGLGRGRRRFWAGPRRAWQALPEYPTRAVELTPEDEKRILKSELETLEAEKKAIEKRLKDMEDKG